MNIHLWDDVVAGPQPDRGHATFTNITLDTKNLNKEAALEGSSSSKAIPKTPTTPATATSMSPRSAGNVWRSVFHPGSNLNSRSVGAHYFDNPAQSATNTPTPTTYDWLYSDETRSKSFR